MPPVEQLITARQSLLQEFPWAEAPIHAAFEELLTKARLGVVHLTMTPMLIVGDSGAGKSRLARRFSEVLEMPCLDVVVAGDPDPKALAGTSRGWSGGRPSALATKIAESGCASLLVLIDEIDKAFVHHTDADRANGGIAGYLLGMLDPETACRQYDTYLMTGCDFSQVSWILTANSIAALPGPLLGRLRVFEIPRPSSEHMEAIARECLRELERRWRLPTGTLPPLEELGGNWRQFVSARGVRRGVEARVAKWTQARAMAQEVLASATTRSSQRDERGEGPA